MAFVSTLCLELVLTQSIFFLKKTFEISGAALSKVNINSMSFEVSFAILNEFCGKACLY